MLVAVLTVLAIWRFVHRYRANRYRREALSELDRMRWTTDAAPDRLAAQLSLLVRRTALGSFSARDDCPSDRNGVAGIPRSQLWRDEFSQGAGRWLVSAPYQQTAPGRDELMRCVGLVDRWIRVHHV